MWYPQINERNVKMLSIVCSLCWLENLNRLLKESCAGCRRSNTCIKQCNVHSIFKGNSVEITIWEFIETFGIEDSPWKSRAVTSFLSLITARQRVGSKFWFYTFNRTHYTRAYIYLLGIQWYNNTYTHHRPVVTGVGG